MTRLPIAALMTATLLLLGTAAHAQGTTTQTTNTQFNAQRSSVTTTTAAPASQPAIEVPVIKPTTTTLENEVKMVANSTNERNFITLNVENDMFGGGTDQNYTSGVRLTYHRLNANLPKFTRTIDKLVPTYKSTPATSIYYSIGQNLYTPADIENPAQQNNDRPWAAYLYGSAGLVTFDDNRIDELEASIGVVGPAALGEQTQKTIHKWVNSPNPKGWRHQLKNEPALMLSWNRRFPERYSIDMPEVFNQTMTFTAEPNIGATVGNVYTYANAGMSFRFNPFEGRYQDAPIKVRPAMPGTGAYVIPEGLMAWQVFGGVEGRAVAQNIFLDGNTFTDSHSVDKKNFVYDATVGVSTAYGKGRISYALVYRSKEFDEQDDPSIFGTVSLGYRF